MRRVSRTFIVAAAIASMASGFGCNKKAEVEEAEVDGLEQDVLPSVTAEEGDAVKVGMSELSVEQVSTMLSDKKVHVFDANNEKTRKKYGVVPEAVLLSSSSQYETQSVLPDDKSAKLVFYCANTDCTASDTAAKRAANAGYGDVNVMRAGIAGWKEAGKELQPFQG